MNPIWYPIQVNGIIFNLVIMLFLSSSPPSFICCDRFLFNEAKSISYSSINDCIVLSIYWSMDSQMWIITTNINPFEPFHCVTVKSNLLDYPKQSVCYQYWTNPNSNHPMGMIGRLESLSFVNVQYVIDRSLVITVMIEMNCWSIETTILIQYHCNNGKENSIIRQEVLIFW